MKVLSIRMKIGLLCSLLFFIAHVTTVFATEAPKVLVVFYSREGHTKLVAQKLAERFQADIEELIDTKKRTGPIGFSAAGKDAIAGKLTKLKPLTHDPRLYDVVLIGTPGWWSNMTPAVRTFLSQYKLEGKRIGIFGTSHLTGIENALQQVADVVSKEKNSSYPRLPLRHRDLGDGVLSTRIEAFYQEVMENVSQKSE